MDTEDWTRVREMRHFLEHGMDLRSIDCSTDVSPLVWVEVKHDEAIYVRPESFMGRHWTIHDGTEGDLHVEARNAYSVGIVLCGLRLETKAMAWGAQRHQGTMEVANPWAHMARWRKASRILGTLDEEQVVSVYEGLTSPDGQVRHFTNGVLVELARRLHEHKPSPFGLAYIRQAAYEKACAFELEREET